MLDYDMMLVTLASQHFYVNKPSVGTVYYVIICFCVVMRLHNLDTCSQSSRLTVLDADGSNILVAVPVIPWPLCVCP